MNQPGLIKIQSLPRRQGSRSDGGLAKFATEQFKTNKFKIEFDQKKSVIYQYDYKLMIDGNTQVAKDSQLYYKVVKELKKQVVDILGFEMHRGQIVYCTKKQPLTTLKCQYDEDGKKLHLEANFKQVKEINLKDITHGNLSTQETQHIFQMLNIKLKNQLKNAGMIELGRTGKYFKKNPDPKWIKADEDNRGNNRGRKGENQESDSFKLLQGFKFTIVQTNRQFALQVDTCFRVLQQESFKDQIQRQLKNMSPADLNKFFCDKTVTANYGNYKNYRIIAIDFTKNPKSTFVQDNNIQISFLDYYWKNYKIKIQDLKQPLIKVMLRTDKKIGTDGKIKKTQIEGYLIPELVSLAGIKDKQASNVKLMRKLAQYTKLTPQTRLDGCQKAIQQIYQKDDLIQITKPLNQKGYVLDLPTLSYQTEKTKPDEKGTIKKLCRLKNPGKFTQYLFVYSIGRNTEEQDRDREQADALIDSLKSSAKIYGVEFKKPAYLQVKGSDAKTWIEAIRKDCQQNGNPQIIILFFNWREQKNYQNLKQLCINQLQCPSQCIRRKTFQNPKAVRSASSKLVIQMNVKIGCAAWKVNIQHPYFKNRKLMYGGLTVSKGSNGSYLSFVGSIDDDLTKFFSACKKVPKFQNISQECFEGIFKQWARHYCKANSTVPDTIIIYRQGLNERQAENQLTQIQFPALCKTIQVMQTNMKLKNYRPECQICIVNKKINSRFFSINNGRIDNPMSGSFTIQNKQSDTFLLVPQYVTQGTSTPTKIKTVIDCSNIPNEALISFTYEQCFNYYNWEGAVRVPAALQFANKLGKLVSQNIKQDVIKGSLSTLLYFL